MTTSPPKPPSRIPASAAGLDRRRFLRLAAGTGLAGLTGLVGCGPNGAGPAPTTFSGAQMMTTGAGASASLRRRLVVVELSGGNDGLAMFQPTADTAGGAVLRDLRPNLLVEDSDLIASVDGFGWHPRLERLFQAATAAGLGIGAAVGVGADEPDFSHFEMEQRWWIGDGSPHTRTTTGFLGRICDELEAGEPVTGISFGGGMTPALNSAKAVTVGLSDAGANWFLRENDPWLRALRGAWSDMAGGLVDESGPRAAARQGLGDATRFAAGVGQVTGEAAGSYPWTDLGQQLRLAAEALVLDPRLRVLHIRQTGYDTHSGQDWRHGELMGELGDALGVFVDDLAERGLASDTIIATTSEFGRRVESNEGGTDHGAASTMLVCGPGVGPLAGQAPSLTGLDDSNLVATARFEDYYATLAGWLGLDPALVLAAGTPMPGLIA